MRTLIVGAGPMGALIGRALESQKGNEVTFLVRSAQKAGLARFKLVEAQSGAIWVREKPTRIGPEDVLPVVELVVLAVQREKLDEAAAIAARVPGSPRIAVFHDGPQVRERLDGRPTAELACAFTAWRAHDTIAWWSPPLVKSLVSGEGDGPSVLFADELASWLKAGGLPARPVARLSRTRGTLMSAGLALVRKRFSDRV